MMHCMVNRRRQVPGRRKASLVQESLNAGLATLIADQQQGHTHKPHHLPHYPVTLESPETDCSLFRGCHATENFRAESDNRDRDATDFPEVDDGTRSKQANGGYNEGSLTGPLQRVCLGSTRHRPYHKVADVREARRASLDRNEAKPFEVFRRGPSLLPSSSFKGARVTPEKLTVDDETGKFAYISLDGRLVNAELATSATSIGGGLGDKEAQAWADFAPMHRVLIVAVSAAAAAAAKHKNSKEIDRLLKTVTDRENELIKMRQQLSDLCKQTITDPSSLTSRTEHPESIPSDTSARFKSPKTHAHWNSGMRCSGMDDTNLKLELHEMDPENLAAAGSKPTPSPAELELKVGECGDSINEDFGLSRDAPVNKDVVLVESPSRGDVRSRLLDGKTFFNEGWVEEEAKWYVNPMVEAPELYYDICTPERGNPMFSTCSPAVRGSLEWTAVRSSFTRRSIGDPTSRLQTLADSPLVSRVQCKLQASADDFMKKLASPESEDRAVHKELTVSRVQCAIVVLDLKKKVMTVVNKEASKFLDALDRSVDEAKAQVEAMQLAVADCWQSPELVALGLSPSEFERLRDAEGTKSNHELLNSEEGIYAWRQYLEVHNGTKEPTEQQPAGETPVCFSVSSPSQDGKGEDFGERKLEETLVSASGAEVKLTTLIAPTDDRQNRGTKCSTQSSFGFAENSTEYIAEQLLGELDKAAIKVADMEIQLKRLENDVLECDAKRKQAESKLAGSIRRDLENQARMQVEVAEMKRQLQLKEAEIADLQRSRKVLLMVKNKEIEELQEDCSLRDAQLDDITAAAQAIKTANAERIAALEDLCSRKDSAIFNLRQEILALETKIHAYRPFQSPAMLRGRRSFMQFLPPPITDTVAVMNDSVTELPRKRNFFDRTLSPPPPPPPPSTSDRVLQRLEDLQREPSNQLYQFGDNPPVDAQRCEEVMEEGRSDHECDQERSSRDISSPPASPVRDDLSELEDSLQALSVDEEVRAESENCSPCEDSSFRICEDQFPVSKPSGFDHMPTKQKTASSGDGNLEEKSIDAGRVLTSSASNIPGLNRVRANVTFTSVTGSKMVKRSSNFAAANAVAGVKKVKSKDFKSPQTSLGNAKVLGPVTPNTPGNHHPKTSSLDLKGGLNSLLGGGASIDSGSKENSAIKRRRWV